MSISSDHIPVTQGRGWTRVDNTSFSFTIQNTLDVRLEYSFVDDPSIKRGLFLNISEFIRDIQQTIYVRAYDLEQHGTIAVLRYDEDLDFGRANLPVINSNINRNRLGIDAYGKNKVMLDNSVASVRSTFEVSPKVWFVDENGIELSSANLSTRAVPDKGGYNIHSGGTLGDSCVLRGKKHPRSRPNRGWIFSATGTIPDKTAQGKRMLGGATEEAGLFFELNNGVLYGVIRQASWQYYTSTSGQTDFIVTNDDILSTSIVYVRSKLTTSSEWVSIVAFTVDTVTNTVALSVGRQLDEEVIVVIVNDIREDLSARLLEYSIDIEKETTYTIQTTSGDTFFIINTIELFVYKNVQTHTRPTLSNTSLPIYHECVNQGDEVSMIIGFADISSEGGLDEYIEYTPIVNQPALPILAGDVGLSPSVLLVAHAPTYYRGRHNTRDFSVLRTNISVEKNTFLTVYITREPVFSTGTLLLKERDDGSAILYDDMLDSAGTALRTPGLKFDKTSGRLIASKRISANQSGGVDNPDISRVNYTLTHGDYLILTASYEKVGTSEVVGSIELGEEI